MASTAKASDEATKEYTVAKGRTVRLDGKDYGPESAVTLTEDEGGRLQELGFLKLEDGTVAVLTDGAAAEAGAEIKEQ